MAQFSHRGAGGHDVVDQGDVLAVQPAIHGEGVDQVAQSLLALQALLARVLFQAAAVVSHGDCQLSVKLAGDDMALVETAPEVAGPVQGHGKQQIRQFLSGVGRLYR